MATETILLSKVLEIMRTPDLEGRAVPFDITYRTLNKNSKSGGRLKEEVGAKLVMQEKGIDPNSVYGLLHFKKKPPKTRKNPNHFENKTRNIRLQDSNIKKIHTLHIITFNGLKVNY